MTNNGYQLTESGLFVRDDDTHDGGSDLPALPAGHGDPPVLVNTKVVRERQTEAEVAERLLAIQHRDRSHEVDTEKVRQAKAKAVEAGKLRRLRANPDAVALRDARVRLWVTVAAVFAAVCALGWSTASVQGTAAGAAPRFSPGWWLAFLVEPLISVGLLATIAVQAYAAMRGATVDPDSEHGRTLRRTQRWLLGLTLTLNTWPYVSPLWTHKPFSPIQVVVHLVGPIVAVRMIHSLPAMWGVLESLPIPGAGPIRGHTGRATDPAQPASSPLTDMAPHAVSGTPVKPVPPKPKAPSMHQLRVALHTAVAAGEDVDPASATSIRDYLGIGMDRARRLRDEWNNPAADYPAA